MDKKIVIITGAPGTGKSTIIESLNAIGYCCYPEISREITLEARKNGHTQLFLEDPLRFSELVLKGRVNQYLNALQENHKIIFIDRGIPDVFAYLDYIGTEYSSSFEIASREHKYSKIFLLPPWEEIYTSDDTRYENYHQAKLIHDQLFACYKKLGYELIEVPKDSVQNRIAFILNQL